MTDVNWAVATTAMEPTAILLSYVAHHLDLGASEIHLFLDSPDPAFEVLAATKPQLRIYRCDAANWSSLHGTERPWDHRLRQVANANLAYNTTRCDWIAHMDADEYMIRTETTFDCLASAPDEVLAISMQNAEQIYWRGWTPRTVLSGFFRKPFDAWDPQIEKVYGGMSAYMTRGFSGYAGGKSFYRVGAGLNLGLHQPRPRSVWLDPNNPAWRWAPRVGILHFDGFTRRHWTRKMAKRLKEDGSQKGGHSPGRTRQIAVATGLQATEIEADRLYDLTRQVSPRQALDLVARGKILSYRFNIAQSLARV